MNVWDEIIIYTPKCDEFEEKFDTKKAKVTEIYKTTLIRQNL